MFTSNRVPGTLRRALSFCAMANQEHLDVLAKGVDEWNAWRRQMVSRARVDLSGAELSRAYVAGATLSFANLTGAKLSKAELDGARLDHAILTDADLESAMLIGTDLRSAFLQSANLRDAYLNNALLGGAVLTGAILSRADLYDADLSEADLREVELGQARVGGTRFGNVDLSKVHGLDEVRHRGPSTIGIDTIYRSHGNIPDPFLRGCGVPENFITYMRSLTGNAFDFYSCFISYSTKDQEFADRLHADLQARGVRCWFAPHDIQGGRKIHEQIDEAIKVYDKLLLILSDASMTSNWVKTEIANARVKEVQQERQMLFPITLVPYSRVKEWKLFDADTGIDSAREVREYFVPDFSNWKDHDSYTKAFDRLVRDLKAEPGEKAEAQPAS
jgi:uncharacterized protein YjbI with pentapeptide repeats